MPSFKGRSKQYDAAKPKSGVMSYLARMNDREVLEAVREIRRKRFSSQQFDYPVPYSVTTEDSSRCHEDTDSSVFSYTVEVQNENGDTDNVSHAAIVTSADSCSRMSETAFEYKYNESLDRDVLDEIAEEDFQYESEHDKVVQKKRSFKQKCISLRGNRDRSKDIIKSIPSVPSIDTESESGSWNENKKLPPPPRKNNYNGFCTDSFGCVGVVNQQYSFLVNSPKPNDNHEKIVTNESRLNFIDGFLLQKLRHKGSSLIDAGNSWLDPLDDEDDNEKSNDVEVVRQIRSLTMKYITPHGKGVTPVASGCPSSFEHIIGRLTGIHMDDEDQTPHVQPFTKKMADIRKQYNLNTFGEKSYETYGTYSMTSSGSYTTENGDNNTISTYGDGLSYATGEFSYVSTGSRDSTKNTLDDGATCETGEYTENSFDDATKSTAGDLCTEGSESTDEYNDSTCNSLTPGTNTNSSSFATNSSKHSGTDNSCGKYSVTESTNGTASASSGIEETTITSRSSWRSNIARF